MWSVHLSSVVLDQPPAFHVLPLVELREKESSFDFTLFYSAVAFIDVLEEMQL
jgi:hypothetical protein